MYMQPIGLSTPTPLTRGLAKQVQKVDTESTYLVSGIK